MSIHIQKCSFSAYTAAFEHAQTYRKCAHVSCGVIVNDELVAVKTSTPMQHAEIEALTSLYCEKWPFVCCERG